MKKPLVTEPKQSTAARIACIALFAFTLLIGGQGCSQKAKGPQTAQQELGPQYDFIFNPPPRKRVPEEPVPVVTPQSKLSVDVRAQQEPTLRNEFRNALLSFGAPVYIRIFKEEKELELWVRRGGAFKLFKKYPVANFSGTIGPKQQEGDQQAPEGFYEVTPTRLNPRSKYHLAFNIGYPNQYDQLHNASGGLIMVHGKQESVGCFAMTDPIIEEIYTIVDQALATGQPSVPVHIFPFRMTAGNLGQKAGSPHISFWRNLLRGYTLFELTHWPPAVQVVDNAYAFSNGIPPEWKDVASLQSNR